MTKVMNYVKFERIEKNIKKKYNKTLINNNKFLTKNKNKILKNK